MLGSDARFHCLFTEYVDGDSLADLRLPMNQGEAFSGAQSDAREILRDLASAIRFTPDRGIVHGDIKPANILSPNRGSASVLIDFGYWAMWLRSADGGKSRKTQVSLKTSGDYR